MRPRLTITLELAAGDSDPEGLLDDLDGQLPDRRGGAAGAVFARDAARVEPQRGAAGPRVRLDVRLGDPAARDGFQAAALARVERGPHASRIVRGQISRHACHHDDEPRRPCAHPEVVWTHPNGPPRSDEPDL
jgi:hypothetical protein